MRNGKEISRRTLLFNSLAIGAAPFIFRNPVAHLMQAILSGMVSTARAADVKPRKYLFLPFMGGPPRWTFIPFVPSAADLPLMVANPCINTRFSGGAPYTSMQYSTVAMNGMLWPWLWRFSVARAGGGMRPMADLMANMFVVRGVHAPSAHGPAQYQRYQPQNIPYTFGSLVSDHSEAYIPAVNFHAEDYKHVSQEGNASVDVFNNGNVLTQLLDGLIASPRSFYSLSKGPMQALLQSTAAELEAQAASESNGFGPSSTALKAAQDAMRFGFGNLATAWPALVGKYRDICARTVGQTLLGINDQPVGSTDVTNRGLAYQFSEGRIIRNADLRTMITANTMPERMAEGFALAEFVLINQLSDNITLGIRPLTGLSAQREGGTSTRFAGFDEHEQGAFCSLIGNTFFNMCLGGCLLELIDRLKAASLFNETLIDASGEMGRNPHVSQKGSDHGGEALDVAMWSGVFPSTPRVVGNVLRQPPASYRYVNPGDLASYPGSWGYGASNPSFGILTMGHVAATQAQILRVPNPARSAPSLVRETAGGIFESLLGMSRLI